MHILYGVVSSFFVGAVLEYITKDHNIGIQTMAILAPIYATYFKLK